jgi:hypothetical protein
MMAAPLASALPGMGIGGSGSVRGSDLSLICYDIADACAAAAAILLTNIGSFLPLFVERAAFHELCG